MTATLDCLINKACQDSDIAGVRGIGSVIPVPAVGRVDDSGTTGLDSSDDNLSAPPGSPEQSAGARRRRPARIRGTRPTVARCTGAVDCPGQGTEGIPRTTGLDSSDEEDDEDDLTWKGSDGEGAHIYNYYIIYILSVEHFYFM